MATKEQWIKVLSLRRDDIREALNNPILSEESKWMFARQLNSINKDIEDLEKGNFILMDYQPTVDKSHLWVQDDFARLLNTSPLAGGAPIDENINII